MKLEKETLNAVKTPDIKIETVMLRINGIAGIHYTGESSPSSTLVIFGSGAPLPPDNGTLVNAPQIVGHGFDVFVPDYIGSGRSDGKFTPTNCIRTFTQLFENFVDGCVGTNVYDGIKREMRYDRVIIMGRSFAGTYIPVLPRFNLDIKELAVFYPVVDSKSQGTMEEETNELFMRSFKEDGYHHIYRGVLDPRNGWWKHLENEDDLSPMDNIQHLENAKMFIGHGKKDTTVSYRKSVIYYDLLLKQFPNKDKDFLLGLYSQGNHGPSTAIPATIDYFEWLDKQKK